MKGGGAAGGGNDPASLGTGPVPHLPNLPPPPTGKGGIPTGSPATDKKLAVDVAVEKLRDVGSALPSLMPAIEGWIMQLKSSAGPPGGAIGEPPTMKPPPGPTADVDSSGSPGPV
jgi:hypothetical protein